MLSWIGVYYELIEGLKSYSNDKCKLSERLDKNDLVSLLAHNKTEKQLLKDNNIKQAILR